MSRIYTSSFDAVAVSAAQDLFELVAPSTGVVLLHELGLSQSSDYKDAEEEGLRLRLRSGQTTSGSGGSTPAAVPRLLGDAAYGGTVEANNTTQATAGTIVVHHVWCWNIRVPFQQIWTPETRPVLRASRRGTVELVAAPADAITMSGYIVFEEIS